MTSNQLQPIPPPSEPMQFRAIGLVSGTYVPSEERFNRGTLIAEDGTQLDAVLLGQVMSLVKKYVDLEKSYLWVVYPRTRDKERVLHLQIVGVWSADGFGPVSEEREDAEQEEDSPAGLEAPLEDGYFSIRGQIVYQSNDKNLLYAKIKQAPRKSKEDEEGKSFKLRINGSLPQRAIGYFWDLHVKRDGSQLNLLSGSSVGIMPLQKKKKRPQRSAPGGPRPVNKGHHSRPQTGKAIDKRPPRKVPKPIKRQDPPPQS